MSSIKRIFDVGFAQFAQFASSLGAWALAFAVGLSVLVGCGEFEPMVPNSENGVFFADNQYAIASGWKSDITLVGPQTSRQNCDPSTGVCGHEHVSLKVLDVRSLDESVVVALGSKPFHSVLARGGAVQVQAVSQGVAMVEADVEIEGEVLTDRFEVRVEEVARVHLSRGAGGVAPNSRYSGCRDDQSGVYVLDSVQQAQDIQILMSKANAENEALRGYGVYPITLSPEKSVEFVSYDELRQVLTFRPTSMGQIKLQADKGGNALDFRFVDESGVNGLVPAVFTRDQYGVRQKKVNQLVAGGVYDVALFPTVNGGWLCGGDITVRREVLTPSNCSLYGEGHNRSEQLIKASRAGECRVRFVSERAAGGQGIVFDLRLDVIPGEYAEEPDW